MERREALDKLAQLSAAGSAEARRKLADIATGDEDSYYRGDAVERLVDQTLLAKIATDDPVNRVRIAAVAELTDSAALAALARSSTDREVSGFAHIRSLVLSRPAREYAWIKESMSAPAEHGNSGEGEGTEETTIVSVDGRRFPPIPHACDYMPVLPGAHVVELTWMEETGFPDGRSERVSLREPITMKLTAERGLVYRFKQRNETASFTTGSIDAAVLEMACSLGNREDCVECAQQEAQRNAAVTTLGIAADKGYLDVVKQLLEKGVAIETRNEFGFTALMIAAESGQLAMVKLLLEKGAAIDAKSTDGTSSLWVAAYAGHLDVVTLLLAKGANPNADVHGQTALLIAEQNRRTEMAELLRKSGAK